ncbi:hypothetical protein Tco_0959967 [Tanacetum coccineum]
MTLSRTLVDMGSKLGADGTPDFSYDPQEPRYMAIELTALSVLLEVIAFFLENNLSVISSKQHYTLSCVIVNASVSWCFLAVAETYVS